MTYDCLVILSMSSPRLSWGQICQAETNFVLSRLSLNSHRVLFDTIVVVLSSFPVSADCPLLLFVPSSVTAPLLCITSFYTHCVFPSPSHGLKYFLVPFLFFFLILKEVLLFLFRIAVFVRQIYSSLSTKYIKFRVTREEREKEVETNSIATCPRVWFRGRKPKWKILG